jgi:catechol 2,3-dioxygenase-like lactoylglutathione lyase family enzyme
MSKWIIGTLLFVLATVTWAETKQSDPRLQYVGAITINSPNPKALSAWYTEKLGLDASSEYHGYYFGSLRTKSVDFHLGIHPIPKGATLGAPNISITFRVSDFQSYTADLKSRGLVPTKEQNDKTGHFFTLKDPDGNEITIWGE